MTASSVQRDENGLRLEGMSLSTIADQFGTPVYVYSGAILEEKWRAFDNALRERKHLICYSVKACSNIAVLQLLARLGSGFDIVSGGELERVRRAGGDLSKVVFSGVGKLPNEIEQALRSNIRCLNVESASELKQISRVANRLGCVAPITLRINPDVIADTHDYIATGSAESKFGMSSEQARHLIAQISGDAALQMIGIGCHIGSQITVTEPFARAAERMVEFADQCVAEGMPLRQISFGGGFAVGEEAATAGEYIQALLTSVKDRPWEILIEPGRSISGEAGLLLTRVSYLKTNGKKKFAIVDAAMNDFIRPALYQAQHEVVAVKENIDVTPTKLDIVGPVCESGDFIARDCRISVREGDLLAVLTAGAYGFSMSGNYNSRPRAAEVMVDDDNARLIRMRETVDGLMEGECLLDE